MLTRGYNNVSSEAYGFSDDTARNRARECKKQKSRPPALGDSRRASVLGCPQVEMTRKFVSAAAKKRKRADAQGVTPSDKRTQNIALGYKSMLVNSSLKNGPIMNGARRTNKGSASTTETKGKFLPNRQLSETARQVPRRSGVQGETSSKAAVVSRQKENAGALGKGISPMISPRVRRHVAIRERVIAGTARRS